MSTANSSKQIPAQLKDLQGQVDEVMGAMRYAAEAVLDRGHRLNELSARAEALELQANAFRRTTTNVRKKARKSHLKWTCIFGGIAVIILAVVNTILFF